MDSIYSSARAQKLHGAIGLPVNFASFLGRACSKDLWGIDAPSTSGVAGLEI